MEIWKNIVGYEGKYQVSNLGNIKVLFAKKEKIMKLAYKKNGYVYISLTKNNISKTFRVHRLVAMAFISNIDNKPYINHINGIKTDNRVENLEWCTAKENTKHAISIGLKKNVINLNPAKGNKHWNSKLKEEDVIFIKQNPNIIRKELAKRFNVCTSTIDKIYTGKLWSHL